MEPPIKSKAPLWAHAHSGRTREEPLPAPALHAEGLRPLAPLQSARIFVGFAVEESAILAVGTHYSEDTAATSTSAYLIQGGGSHFSADRPLSRAINRNGNRRTRGEFVVRPDRIDGEIASIGAVDMAR